MDNNFDRQSQVAFDNLNESPGWTWKGIAKAFARMYDASELEELKSEIELEIESKEELS
jgi:hypothetical protein